MSDILQHREDGILTLTFNRLDKKNAITRAMYNVLADALFAAAEDATVRVVVLQGHEQVFTALDPITGVQLSFISRTGHRVPMSSHNVSAMFEAISNTATDQ